VLSIRVLLNSGDNRSQNRAELLDEGLEILTGLWPGNLLLMKETLKSSQLISTASRASSKLIPIRVVGLAAKNLCAGTLRWHPAE
jgi:hypothetical protein